MQELKASSGLPITVNPMIDFNKAIAETVKLFGKDIWNHVKLKYKDGIAKSEIEYVNAYEEYLRRATEKYSKVKTLLFDKQPQELYTFYECIGLGLSSNEKRLALKHSITYNTEDVRKVFEIGKNLIITGKGGIGKTTMLRHFFLDSIKNHCKIPIFVELRNISKDESVLERIYKNICNLGFSLEIQYFEHGLTVGNHLILFDGYDEVVREIAGKVSEEIKDLRDKYPLNNIIITSRPTDAFVGWQQFTELDALPLDLKQATSMIDKLKYNREVQDRFIQALESGLYKSHKSFASTPLLLTIMLLTYEDHASIPSRLHTFYEQAFVVLFSRYDATKDFERKKKSNLEFEDFKKLLSKFCFKTFFHAEYQFSETQLIEILSDCKKNDYSTLSSKDYIDDLVNSVCILVRDGLNYTFSHRSFQEYFAAIYVTRLSDVQQNSLLCSWIENGHVEFQTGLLGILYELEDKRLIYNAYIPILEEIKAGYDSVDKIEWFLKTIFDKVSYSFDENDDGNFNYYYANGFIRNILNSIIKTFKGYNPEDRILMYSTIKKMKSILIQQGLRTIELTYMKAKNSDDSPALEEICKLLLDEYTIAFTILDELKNKVETNTNQEFLNLVDSL